MSAAAADLHTLLDRARQGCPDATRRLVDDYSEPILAVVRWRLNPSVRTLYDSADFVQLVWRDFFAKALHEQTFETPQALMGFLLTLARNHVVGAVRQRLTRQKYDLRRQDPLETVAQDEERHPEDPTPGPLLLVLAEDQWERLLFGLPDHYRQILMLLRDGYTHTEVARQLRLNEKTIRRVVGLARGRLQERPN